MTVKIIIGDVREKLRQLPAESVNCVVTSPPYWGLRDYGVDGQIGMERTLGEHLAVMVDVFREVRRVLRKDGTCWVNYGDCYATSPNGRSAADTKTIGNDDRTFRDKPFSTIGPIYNPNHDNSSRVGKSGNKGNPGADKMGRIEAGGILKPKDLCMLPNRFAIAMQEDGWWVRSEIIWHKPNPMPESIKDRPGSSHEKIFLFTRSQKYYYDSAAVAETSIYQPGGSHADVEQGGFKGKGKIPGTGQRAFRSIQETRNLRNVWTVPTAAFSEAHFATFPPDLIEPCIKAGCPEVGTVLDPFGGSGTTGLVADRLKRNAILIELNPEYAVMAERRIKGDAPMFTEVLTA